MEKIGSCSSIDDVDANDDQIRTADYAWLPECYWECDWGSSMASKKEGNQVVVEPEASFLEVKMVKDELLAYLTPIQLTMG